MPTPIPQTTLSSSQYVSFGQNGYYASGFIQIANGAVDVIVNQTNSRGSPAIGISGPVLSPNLTAGQYTFSKGEGTFITGVQIRPANGNISSPAQAISGMLYEPSSAFIIPIAASTLTQNISSSMQQIAQQNLAVLAASVSFSNIPQTFTNLRLVTMAFSDQAADTSLLLRFNGDAGNNYETQNIVGAGGAATANQTGLGSSAQIGAIPTHTAATWGVADVLIPLYTGAINHSFISTFMDFGSSAFAGLFGGLWFGAAAINSITVFPVAGNFEPSSQFTLYGY